MNLSEDIDPASAPTEFEKAFRLWRQTPWVFTSQDVEQRTISYVPQTDKRKAALALAGAKDGYTAFVFTENRSTLEDAEPLMSSVRISVTSGSEEHAPVTMESTDIRAHVLAALNSM